jgi:hypothetical protein
MVVTARTRTNPAYFMESLPLLFGMVAQTPAYAGAEAALLDGISAREVKTLIDRRCEVELLR